MHTSNFRVCANTKYSFLQRAASSFAPLCCLFRYPLCGGHPRKWADMANMSFSGSTRESFFTPPHHPYKSKSPRIARKKEFPTLARAKSSLTSSNSCIKPYSCPKKTLSPPFPSASALSAYRLPPYSKEKSLLAFKKSTNCSTVIPQAYQSPSKKSTFLSCHQFCA